MYNRQRRRDTESGTRAEFELNQTVTEGFYIIALKKIRKIKVKDMFQNFDRCPLLTLVSF